MEEIRVYDFIMKLNKSYRESGVYKITNNVNGKFYIGSSNNVYRRFNSHLSSLRSNSHSNEILQRSWNKYGEDNFSFAILEVCDNRLEREQFFIDDLIPDYNILKRVRGVRITPFSEKHKKNLSLAQQNSIIKHSEKYKESVAEKMRSLWRTKEYKEKMLSAFSTDEYKENRSVSSKSVWKRPNTRKNFDESWKTGFVQKGRKNGVKDAETVLKIRHLHSSNRYTYTELKEMFGVSYNTIRRVISRETWDWV
jgi:group I intron endonuclease